MENASAKKVKIESFPRRGVGPSSLLDLHLPPWVISCFSFAKTVTKSGPGPGRTPAPKMKSPRSIKTNS